MYCISDNDTQIDESISTNASIIQNGSNVIVDCVRDEGNLSFVVVYKAHGNSTLNVVQNKTLPFIVPLNPYGASTWYAGLRIRLYLALALP